PRANRPTTTARPRQTDRRRRNRRRSRTVSVSSAMAALLCWPAFDWLSGRGFAGASLGCLQPPFNQGRRIALNQVLDRRAAKPGPEPLIAPTVPPPIRGLQPLQLQPLGDVSYHHLGHHLGQHRAFTGFAANRYPPPSCRRRFPSS